MDELRQRATLASPRGGEERLFFHRCPSAVRPSGSGLTHPALLWSCRTAFGAISGWTRGQLWRRRLQAVEPVPTFRPKTCRFAARSPARRSPPSTPGAADSLRCYDTRGRCRRQRSRLSATMRPPAQDSPSPQSSLPASCTVRACSTSRGGQIWSAGHPCRRLLRRRLSATARVCLGAGASTFCACITHHYKQQ